MSAIFITVLPVFTLILLGFLAAKVRYLSDGAGKVLAEFGFKVAMPALLFRAALNVDLGEESPLALWAAFLGSSSCIWILAVLTSRFVLRRPAHDAPAVALATTFGNTVMLGIPMGLIAFGPAAATPMALLVSIHTPFLWIIGTMQQEWSGRTTGVSIWQSLGGVLWDLVRNPIILSLVLGAFGWMAGLKLDPLSDNILSMLGMAAVPAALFALGMTVAGFQLQGHSATLVAIITLKMLIFPLIAWAMVTYVVTMPPLWSNIVIMFAALPVGANAYLFAARYERAVGSVSASVAVSTLIAAGTMTLVLALLNGTLAFGSLINIFGIGISGQ